jgi:adenylosuccinate synthase
MRLVTLQNFKIPYMSVSIIVGAQWGDEGKGKLVDYFASQNEYVVRFQGGNNAGHTLVVDGETYKLHLLPSGVLYPNKRVIIGAGTLVDPEVLLEEIRGIEAKGIEPNLGLSGRAHVILPSHKILDGAISDSQGKLAAGSTKRGIAPVAGDKAYRNGVRIIDLIDPEVLRDKLSMLLPIHQKMFTGVYNNNIQLPLEETYQKLLELGKSLSKYITDTERELYHAQMEGKKILIEGAQGIALDPDYGIYPHTTSTNNVAGYAYVGSGLVPSEKPRIVGVTKAYLSRVGQSPLPSEIHGDDAEELRQKGGEFGTTTGRARRVGWLDLVHLKQAVQAHGLSELAITKVDILTGLSEIPVCIGYTIDGRVVDELPLRLSDYRNAKAVYKTLPGWSYLPQSIESYNDLPQELQQYVEFIETFVGCKITLISYGPERNETLVRDNTSKQVKIKIGL